MRRFVVVLAVGVFLAALILDTGALVRVGAYYIWAFARAHPWWVVAALALMAGWAAWRRWRPARSKRGRKRKGRRQPGGKKRRRVHPAGGEAPRDQDHPPPAVAPAPRRGGTRPRARRAPAARRGPGPPAV